MHSISYYLYLAQPAKECISYRFSDERGKFHERNRRDSSSAVFPLSAYKSQRTYNYAPPIMPHSGKRKGWRKPPAPQRSCCTTTPPIRPQACETTTPHHTSLNESIIERESLHDSRVLLGSLLELVKREAVVLVQVHVAEDLVDALLGRVLVFWERDHLARHLVYAADDLEHLVVCDEAVLVDVVELERPC